MMITKRQFSVTIVIFITLLLLFMGFQVGKDAVSSPDRNKHIPGMVLNVKGASRSRSFVKLNKSGTPDESSKQGEWALYCGKEDSEYAATVKEWSFFSGVPVAAAKELPDESAESLPGIILLGPEAVEGQSEQLEKLMEQGVDIILMALPEFDYVKADRTLQRILGICRMYQENITLQGVHLFKGFLLGGERIFQEETGDGQTGDESETLQDLELDIPWYSVRTVTKTYMRGILSDEDAEAASDRKLKNEDMPAIVWRNSYENAQAYAVNGTYLKNRRAGIGMLQAMMYERTSFVLYPVVNAQVFSVDNFPILTDENQEEVENFYGRSVTKVQTDIIMPMFISLSSKYDKKPGCFLSVKYDRNDEAQPQKGVLQNYLSMIDEMGGELALSGNYRGDIPLSEALSSDLAYLEDEAPTYRITAVMSSSRELSRMAEACEAEELRDIRTVVMADYYDSLPVVGYLNEWLTYQQTTSDLRRHTFTDDLELLGVQTLLAYSNGYYSMSNAFYPKTPKDEWQNSSRDVLSNLTTYSNPFRAEDNLTVTECDARIRTYFDMEYEVGRSDDVITLTSDRGSEKNIGYFILRTHNEKVVSVSGGEFKKMEEDAYLISAVQDKLEIRLTSTLAGLVELKGSNR